MRTEFYERIPVPMKVQEQIETEELRQARRALGELEELRRTGLPPRLGPGVALLAGGEPSPTPGRLAPIGQPGRLGPIVILRSPPRGG